MKAKHFEILHRGHDQKRKVRAKLLSGKWSDAGYVEAGLGTFPQNGVRLCVYNDEGTKLRDEFLYFDEIDDVEIVE